MMWSIEPMYSVWSSHRGDADTEAGPIKALKVVDGLSPDIVELDCAPCTCRSACGCKYVHFSGVTLLPILHMEASRMACAVDACVSDAAPRPETPHPCLVRGGLDL